jgi:putative spermidine/putrescine transport system permease protein
MRGRRAILQYLMLSLLIVVMVAPFAGLAVNAFASRWFFPQLVPEHWSLDAWRSVLSGRSRVPEAIMNSMILALAVTVMSVAIGFPAARVLGSQEFRGGRAIRFLMLSPTMVPPLAVAMGLTVTFLRLGLGGTLVGVGLVHLVPVLPYVVLTLTGVFSNYSTVHEETARTLGATPGKVLLRITLPAIMPGLVVASLFSFLISWSQYILTMLVGGGRVMTMPVLLFSTIPGGDNATIALQSLIFVAPSLIILGFTSRYLTGTSAAMRGLGRI